MLVNRLSGTVEYGHGSLTLCPLPPRTDCDIAEVVAAESMDDWAEAIVPLATKAVVALALAIVIIGAAVTLWLALPHGCQLPPWPITSPALPVSNHVKSGEIISVAHAIASTRTTTASHAETD